MTMKNTRRRLAGITATTIAAGLLLAAPAQAGRSAPADAPGHNARVAEHLMQSHTGLNEHNARVAEYLQMLQAR
jgi:hypothetical protein